MIDPSQIDRFLFRGYAVGFGGLIWKPSGVDFPAEASVCIPLTGGRAENEISGPISISEPGGSGFKISFERAKSTANGQYLANRTSSRTTVTTEIHTVRIESAGRTVEIKSLELEMESEHSLKRGEQTRIRVATRKPIVEFQIGIGDQKFPIGINYARKIMDDKLTYDDLKDAYERDEHFHAEHAKLFKKPPDHPHGSFPASDGVAVCSIVSSVDGLDNDDLKKLGVTVGSSPNEILIPNFGLIALGEMIVYTHERRLTLVRLALGCPTQGNTTLGEVGTDGNNWPP